MLISIGARSGGDDDLVGLLGECHVRIRKFTALARQLAAATDLPAAEVADAATAVRRYFAEALPLHVADEDLSIVPRLRGRDAAVDAALAAMSEEHVAHEPALARLIALCDALAAAPASLPQVAGELAEVAAGLEASLRAHLEGEERVIFPALRALPAADRAAIVRELRARRAPADAVVTPPAP